MVVNKTEEYIKTLMQEDQDKGYNVLIKTYHSQLMSYAIRIVDQYDVAEDIVQDVFLNFWDKELHQGITSSYKSYLVTAVRNKSLNYIQREKRHYIDILENIVDEGLEEIEQKYTISERYNRVLIHINALPTQQRKILLKIVCGNMKYADVANELSISKNTVKTQLSRAYKKIRSSMAIFL